MSNQSRFADLSEIIRLTKVIIFPNRRCCSMILLYTPILNDVLKTAITYRSIHIFRSLSSIFSMAYRSVVRAIRLTFRSR